MAVKSEPRLVMSFHASSDANDEPEDSLLRSKRRSPSPPRPLALQGLLDECSRTESTVASDTPNPMTASTTSCDSSSSAGGTGGEKKKKVESEGPMYCYMAVHPIRDRKKDTCVGYARNPMGIIHAYNHGKVQHKDARMAAPYWSLAAAAGPLASEEECTRFVERWVSGTRGVNSKLARGRSVAADFNVPYFCYDEEKPVTACRARAYVASLKSERLLETFERMQSVLQELRDRAAAATSDSAAGDGSVVSVGLHGQAVLEFPRDPHFPDRIVTCPISLYE